MTIFTESGEGSIERDRAAEADAGFLVAALRSEPDEILEEGIFGRVRGENEDVVVGLAELRGDRELGVGDVGFAEQLFELLGSDRGELDVAGVEFADE